MKRKYNVMRDFRIDEISGVDNPAQKGARVVIRKRDETAFQKQILLLSNVDGHSHLIDASEEGGMTSYGETPADIMAESNAQTDAGAENAGHCHPWVRNLLGEITVGMAEGHTHAVLAKASFSAEQRRHLADSGAAMPDGSFPIRNRTDLENAIHDFGRANNKAGVARHIASRAKALGATDLLPTQGKL